ncbi:MAG: transposase [Candidatus Binatia bacterium]
MAKDTAPTALQAWHNSFVAQYYGTLGAYDAEGIFIADGTYLFVPDNPKYEGSDRLVFDEDNHPVNSNEIESLPTERKLRLHRERCYRKVSLLHTTWEKDFYLYTGVNVRGGRAAECPQLRPLVDGFVQALGKGIMKVLVHDRGFIDGATVSHNKRVNEVDTVFPLKKRMDCWEEAWCLAELSRDPWKESRPRESLPEEEPGIRPEFIRRRERKRQATLQQKKKTPSDSQKQKPTLVRTLAKAIRDLRIWQSCEVPIHTVALRDEYDNGEERRWVLATTMEFEDVFRPRQYYQLRPTVEERFRQTKCFWDLANFRSTSFALVVNQLVFVLMAYSLVQIFLLKTGRKELARRVRTRLLEELMHQEDQFAIYCDGRVAFVPHQEFHEILLTLDEHARRKILGKIREIRARKTAPPEKPWRP